MSETLNPELQIACFGSIPEQHLAGDGKLTGESPTYLRYGSPIHTELENRVAELAEVEPEDILIFNNGLSAIDATIDAALELIEPGSDKKPKIAIPSQLYGGSTRLITKKIRQRGLLFTVFDGGSIEEIEEAIEESDLVFLETVANAPDAPVVDHRAVIDIQRKQEKQPFIVFDRTLPLATECDVYDCTTAEDNVAILESATKGYTNNAEKLGLVVSKNPRFKQAIREERNDGSIPGVGSTRYVLELLPTKEEFTDRNRRVFANTGAVALALFEASEAVAQRTTALYGASEVEAYRRTAEQTILESKQIPEVRFMVDHPSLPNHTNYGQAHVPSDGNVSPVIFLTPATKGTEEEKQNIVARFARKIADDPTVDKLIQRSDSFAFDITAVHSSRELPYVRIAPGANIDPAEVASALFNAITATKYL